MKLLKYKKEYWKKRYTIRWTKFGDESTKLFHAAATERYRKNTITSIETSDGRVVMEHNEKAAVLLETFKGRMGTTTNPHMCFNLEELILRNDNLEQLSAPFSKEEIDKVIKLMPTDKSPGPDQCFQVVRLITINRD